MTAHLRAKAEAPLFILICILVAMAAATALNRHFARDELEHIHTAWLILSGSLPYADFFQNHHPLLWILLLPVLKVAGESLAVLWISRILMLAFFLGTVWLVFSLARLISASKEIALYAALGLLSMAIFLEKGLEIRPDVPQVFFSLLSVTWLIRFFKRGGVRRLVFSGLALSAALLFLQKAVFLLPPLGLVLVFALRSGRIRWRQLFLFSATVFIPLAIFGVVLYHLGLWPEYWLTCWRMHIHHLDSFHPLGIIGFSILQNPVHWLLALSAGARLVRLSAMMRRRFELAAVTLCGLGVFLSVFLVKHPHRQYFLLPVALMAVPSAVHLKAYLVKRALPRRVKIRLAALSLAIPLIFMGVQMFSSQPEQRDKIRYVMENSSAGDLIYDGNIEFNIFRRDMHYFWYSIRNRGLESFNRLTDNRFGDYDICRLIKEKKPRFISDTVLDVEDCGLGRLYRKTDFEGLYIRIPEDH